MRLFYKEKELILRLVNGILLIWVIASMVLVFANMINYALSEPKMTEEEYVSSDRCYWYYDVPESTEKSTEETCKNSYSSYEYDYNSNKRQDLVMGLICFSQFIIVGAALVFLNKEK